MLDSEQNKKPAGTSFNNFLTKCTVYELREIADDNEIVLNKERKAGIVKAIINHFA